MRKANSNLKFKSIMELKKKKNHLISFNLKKKKMFKFGGRLFSVTVI